MSRFLFTSMFNRWQLTAKAALSTSVSSLVLVGWFGPAQARDVLEIPQIDIIATRLDAGIAGTSSTVIGTEEIARNPSQTLPDLLASRAGIQLQSLYGVGAGVQTSVDLRGFGAFATANTLVLINGRRLNDLDLAGVDLAALPVQSIERIEIVRGNSGAVLYGDNAVGGVVNIVTKSGVNAPPRARVEAGFGSFNRREGNVSASASSGPFAVAAFSSALKTDGYRDNNQQTQESAVGDVRYTTDRFSAFFNLSGDNQSFGLPGGRRVTLTSSQFISNPRGAATPFDHAEKHGLNATGGFSFRPSDSVEIIVDGGVRDKIQHGTYLGAVPLSPFAANYVDSHLQTWSMTPRAKITTPLLGLPSTILTGIDLYDAGYDSSRSQYAWTRPIHVYALRQTSAAAYWQQTITVLPSTDLALGARLQNTRLNARDTYDPTAPNAFSAQSFPLRSSETQHALHAGLEHRFNDALTAFARYGRAFRTPNVDERLVTGPAFDPNNFFAPIPQTFMLGTQTSWDIEGGLKLHHGPFDAQFSVFDMRLRNEIHFDPITFYNINLDPTRRVGAELQSRLAITEQVRLTGSLSHIRATFREGVNAGHDIPLISRWSGAFGVSWDVWQKYLMVDATARFQGARRLDNDQANFQPPIPAASFVDVKLSGEVQQFFWSLAVNNVFDRKTYDYGIASAVTYGTYDVYPLPGRNFVLKAGMTF